LLEDQEDEDGEPVESPFLRSLYQTLLHPTPDLKKKVSKRSKPESDQAKGFKSMMQKSVYFHQPRQMETLMEIA